MSEKKSGEGSGEIILYTTSDGKQRIDVRLDGRDRVADSNGYERAVQRQLFFPFSDNYFSRYVAPASLRGGRGEAGKNFLSDLLSTPLIFFCNPLAIPAFS